MFTVTFDHIQNLGEVDLEVFDKDDDSNAALETYKVKLKFFSNKFSHLEVNWNPLRLPFMCVFKFFWVVIDFFTQRTIPHLLPIILCSVSNEHLLKNSIDVNLTNYS